VDLAGVVVLQELRGADPARVVALQGSRSDGERAPWFPSERGENRPNSQMGALEGGFGCPTKYGVCSRGPTGVMFLS
jgi:hypothetical protein